VLVDGLGGPKVEPLDEAAELAGRCPLRDPGRAADVREQERGRDLGAADARLRELLDAVLAEGRVASIAAEPEMPQDGAAGTLERRGTQLAAWR
jgi:hypothetical protein